MRQDAKEGEHDEDTQPYLYPGRGALPGGGASVGPDGVSQQPSRVSEHRRGQCHLSVHGQGHRGWADALCGHYGKQGPAVLFADGPAADGHRGQRRDLCARNAFDAWQLRPHPPVRKMAAGGYTIRFCPPLPPSTLTFLLHVSTPTSAKSTTCFSCSWARRSWFMP